MPNPPEDPEGGTGTPTPDDGAPQVPVSAYSDHLCCRIEPRKTISLDRRAFLTAQLVDQLQLTPLQRAMRMSVIYTVQPEAYLPPSQRTRSYLRFAIDFDASRDALDFAKWQAGVQLKQAFARTQDTLAAHYKLTEIATDPLSATLQAGGCSLPPAELVYTNWTPSEQWLGPAHVQPMLDRLLERPGCSALEITVERAAASAAAPASFRLQVLAYGEATDEQARDRLVNEYRGRGVLIARTPDHDSAPGVEWICPAAAPVGQRHSQLQGLCAPSLVAVTLTALEAGHLVPLPMVLGPA